MVLLADALMLLPLVVHRVPSMDALNHAAVARLLVDGTSSAYVADPGALPYALPHLVLGPLVVLLGPGGGVQAFMVMLSTITLAVLHSALRRQGAPWFVHLAAPLVVLNASFFWGYVPMLAGLPLAIAVLWAVAEYVRDRRRAWLVAACVVSAATTAMHVLWLPALGLIWAVAASLRPRELWRAALLGLVAALLPALPGLLVAGGNGGETALHFNSLDAAWNQIKRQWSPFDRGVGRAGGLILLLGLAACAFRSRISMPPAHRFAARTAIAVLVLAFVSPVEIAAFSQHAWGVGFRFYVLGFVSLALTVRAPSGARWLAAAFGVGFAFYVFGFARATAEFDACTEGTVSAIEALAPDAAIWVDTDQVKLGDFWPAVDQHLAAAHVARGGAYSSDVFAGGHVPIRLRGPAPAPTHALVRPKNRPPPGCRVRIYASPRWILYRCEDLGG